MPCQRKNACYPQDSLLAVYQMTKKKLILNDLFWEALMLWPAYLHIVAKMHSMHTACQSHNALQSPQIVILWNAPEKIVLIDDTCCPGSNSSVSPTFAEGPRSRPEKKTDIFGKITEITHNSLEITHCIPRSFPGLAGNRLLSPENAEALWQMRPRDANIYRIRYISEVSTGPRA